MASLHQLENGKWQVRWEGRKQTFEKFTPAKKFKAKVENDKYLRKHPEAAKGLVTFRQYAEKWQASQLQSPSYESSVRSHLNCHIYPAIGDLKIGLVTHDDMQALAKSLSLSLAASSIKTIIETAKVIFKAAVDDLTCEIDPCSRLKLTSPEKKQVIPLTVEQVRAMASNFPARYHALILFAASSGLRQGELFGVKTFDFDWTLGQGNVRVVRQVQPGSRGDRDISPNKTRRWRTVPLNDATIDLLRTHMEEYPPNDDRFIFTNTQGAALHRRVFDRYVVKAREAAAEQFLATAEEYRGVDEVRRSYHMDRARQLDQARTHDLRHFYASALIRQGLSPTVVAARLGHASAAMTLNVYGHLWPDDGDRTRDALDNIFKID